jgi:ubiquinone biosynthesis protein UbiJ
MGLFDTGAAAALNHLLKREAWAREKLAPFAGELVELRFAPLPPLRLGIAEGGQAAPPEAGREATLVITARPGIFAALAKGEDHLMHSVDVSGNARLATEILSLLRYLRWDVEEDLSKVFGDVLAHRMVGTAREFASWQAEAGRRLAENVMEYAVEERRMLVSRTEFETFAAGVAKLRDDLARLEQRIDRRAGPPGSPTGS